MDHFSVFLETVARRRWGQSVDVEAATVAVSLLIGPPVGNQADKLDQIAVWNTLLELTLRVFKSESIPYDPMHALILCSSHSYTPGLEGWTEMVKGIPRRRPRRWYIISTYMTQPGLIYTLSFSGS